MSFKLGEIILDFKDTPVMIESLLHKRTRATKQLYENLQYSGKGKSYISSGKMKYAKNRVGFYVLELPLTCKSDSSGKCIQSTQEKVGYKLGKASAVAGLIARLGNYYVEYGKNVKILHLRIFNAENLSYFGSKNRTDEYENAIKSELKRRGAKPNRGASNSEYYKNLNDIKNAIETVDKNPKLIGDINQSVELEANDSLQTGDKLILLMEEKGTLVPYKLTLGEYFPRRKNKKWDVTFDVSDEYEYKFDFPESYKNKVVSSGWTYQNSNTAKRGIWKQSK